MPMQWSPRNSSTNKVGRKVRVSLGNPKGSRDGVKTLGSRSDNVETAHKKVRVTREGSKKSADGARVIEFKGKGVKKVHSRETANEAVSYVDRNGKLSGVRSWGKKDLKPRNGKNQEFEVVGAGNSSQKRKRIYADEDKIFGGNRSKYNSKSQKDVVGSVLDKGQKASRGKGRGFNDTSGSIALAEGRSESIDKKNWRGKMGSADKSKNVLENGNRTWKNSEKRKDPLATEKAVSQWKHVNGFVEKPRKKNDKGKKGLGTDSSLDEEPRKKKKRVIRIDPHDISNKRLDDNATDNGNGQEKTDLSENDGVEMSKNAQFRAICPSPSILSFVEENLLGRRRDIEFRRAGYNTELSAPLDNIPFSTCSERERVEVPAFRNKLEFFAAAKISTSFPPPDLPEIAFAGRSNVGKSSLLNSLTRQWGVVRTSDKPGLTQTINFFKLGTKLSLVDLPGYGFAYAKDEVKEAWEELVKEYVSTRVGLKRVCLLVDTKWGMKPRDHELIDLMERSQTKYQIVLTKTDLVFPIDVARRAMQIEENLKAKKSAVQPLMMVSSKTGAGIRSLRTVLANVARFVKR